MSETFSLLVNLFICYRLVTHKCPVPDSTHVPSGRQTRSFEYCACKPTVFDGDCGLSPPREINPSEILLLLLLLLYACADRVTVNTDNGIIIGELRRLNDVYIAANIAMACAPDAQPNNGGNIIYRSTECPRCDRDNNSRNGRATGQGQRREGLRGLIPSSKPVYKYYVVEQ